MKSLGEKKTKRAKQGDILKYGVMLLKKKVKTETYRRKERERKI